MNFLSVREVDLWKCCESESFMRSFFPFHLWLKNQPPSPSRSGLANEPPCTCLTDWRLWLLDLFSKLKGERPSSRHDSLKLLCKSWWLLVDRTTLVRFKAHRAPLLASLLPCTE